MAGDDTAETDHFSPDASLKRRRVSGPDDSADYSYPEESVGSAAGTPVKIKLSLKLGALRKRSSDASSTVEGDAEPTVVDDDGTAAAGNEHVDIDGGDECSDHEARSAPAEGRMPRIKLRLSLKPSGDTPSNGSYDHGPYTSPSLVYSPVQMNEGLGSDDNHDAGYNGSDAEGYAYAHVPQTPTRSASAVSIGSRGTGYRRRGRPPLHGRGGMSRRSSGSVAVRPRTPSTPLTPTTTVSLKSSLLRLVKRIRKRDSYGFFLEPVDTSAVPDYLNVIKRPMDLGTMQSKVDAEQYQSIDEFRDDVLLVCNNARKYNGAASIYTKSADRVQEYALVAIERETVKLKRVGKASLPVRPGGNDSDAASGMSWFSRGRSASRTGSLSPSHCGAADEYGGTFFAVDAAGEQRRSSRLRWRGGSESQPNGVATPSSIADHFKWSGGSKKKTKRSSTVPKRLVEPNIKIPLLPDGSVDTVGIEDDIALVPFERDHTALPFIASNRPPPASRLRVEASLGGGAPSVFAHGRYYSPVTALEVGPYATAASTGAVGTLDYGLSSLYGDALGLAYWHSVSNFIEGAGSETTQYAALMMDHLSDNTHCT
ncbi:hypothetical protein GGF46_000221 [Coemansia sp. RSA 552]|nr:hypothetical protein GGF46_000221 [Coemansia sp. RSA 552]